MLYRKSDFADPGGSVIGVGGREDSGNFTQVLTTFLGNFLWCICIIKNHIVKRQTTNQNVYSRHGILRPFRIHLLDIKQGTTPWGKYYNLDQIHHFFLTTFNCLLSNPSHSRESIFSAEGVCTQLCIPPDGAMLCWYIINISHPHSLINRAFWANVECIPMHHW